MNKKTIITISIIGALMVVTTIAVGCGLKSNTETATTDTTATTTDTTTATTDTTGTATTGTTGTTTTDTTATTTTETTGTGNDALITLAEKFAAGYGTFSSAGNFKNITDNYSYMSEALRQSMATFVAGKQAQESSGTTYETVTTVLMSKVLENSGSAATVLVDTYRENSSSNSGRIGKYENALVKFVLENSNWKVSEIKWQGQ